MSTVKFIPNIDLAQKYKIIQLKPRKYDDNLSEGFKDSMLPYFKINFNDSKRSYKQRDDYNKNNIYAKK